MEHTNEIITIDCVNALFWDYSSDDIQSLKVASRDFDHVWTYYIEGKGGEEAFNALWNCWMLKFNVETKNLVIAYALNKYEDEKKQAVQSADHMKRVMRSLRDS